MSDKIETAKEAAIQASIEAARAYREALENDDEAGAKGASERLTHAAKLANEAEKKEKEG